MTVLQKKKILKNLIDSLPEDNLDEALSLIEKLTTKDLSRKKILLELLQSEKELFEKLAK